MRNKVPFLRGLAVLAILLGHVGLYAQDPLLPPRGEVVSLTGLDRWLYRLLGTPAQLSDFAVPSFYVMAGLLCVPAMRAAGRTRYLGRQAVGLLAPLALWSAVAVGVAWAAGSIPSMSTFFRSRLAMLQVEWGYYLPLALLQFYLLAPRLVGFCERRPVAALAVAFAVQALAVGLRVAGSLTGFLEHIPTLGASAGQYAVWRWCGFFVFGLVLGLHPGPAGRWLAAHRASLFAVMIGGLALALLEAESLPEITGDAGWISSQVRPGSTLYAIGWLGWYFAGERRTGVWARRVAQVGGVAFALLLLHPIVYRVLQRLLAALGPDTLVHHPLATALVYLLLGAVPLVWFTLTLTRSRLRPLVRRLWGH